MIKRCEQRFWTKVNRRGIDDCWEYKEFLRNGYGQFRVTGMRSKVGAHRVSFMLSFGWFPQVVRHNCDNRKCCNPNHLLAGTQKQNAQDMVDRGRSTRGERNARRKLSLEQIQIIRKDKSSTNVALGLKYGVHHSTISHIRLAKSWRHVSCD